MTTADRTSELDAALAKGVALFGDRLTTDPELARSVLLDLTGGRARRNVALLVSAVEVKVPREARSLAATLPAAAIREKLSQRLIEAVGCSGESAQWVVGTWQRAISASGAGVSPGLSERVPAKPDRPAVVTQVIDSTPAAALPYAVFWRRAAASVIDSVIVYAAVLLIAMLMGAIIGGAMGASGSSTGEVDSEIDRHGTEFVIVGFIVVWLYYALLESSRFQATVGKKLLRMKVTDLSGNRIGFWCATGRYLSKLLSGGLLCIGYLMAAFDPRRQALHDKIAHTVVVNVT